MYFNSSFTRTMLRLLLILARIRLLIAVTIRQIFSSPFFLAIQLMVSSTL